MSTKGAVSETSFRIHLILVLALAAAGAAVIIGNRYAWRELSPSNRPLAAVFEQGFVLDKIHACTIPRVPAFIATRCAEFVYWLGQPPGLDYFLPQTRRVLIIWPLSAALSVSALAALLLVLRGRRFKKLDEHAPRDWFKTRKLPIFMDTLAVAAALTGFAAAIYTRRIEWLILASGGLVMLWLELGRPRRKFRHIRGSRIADAEEVARLARKTYRRSEFGGLEIGGVPIPKQLEPLNFLIAGAPGTGKSITIAKMIAVMRARGDRVFCSDPRGDYLRRFYRDGDLILNPLDARAAPWSPLAEIRGESDAALVARSLVPDAEGTSEHWHRYAQQLVGGALIHARAQDLTNRDILRLVLVAPLDELRERLGGGPAAGLLQETRMFGDVRSTASPYIQALARLPPGAGASAFSLRAWAQDHAGAACWWNYQDAQITDLRTLISCQLDLLALGVLEQPDSPARRTWLVIDELAAIGRIPVLEDFLARARKAGGCALLGIQAIAQMRRTYGPNSTDAILSCCASTLALAVGDADSAEYMSRLLGESEISVVTRSSGQADSGAQSNISRQLRVERVVLASELDAHALPPRCGFLKLAGGRLPIAPVRLEIQDFPEVTPRFVPRPERPEPPKPDPERPAVRPESDGPVGDAATPAFPLPLPPEASSPQAPIPPDTTPDELIDVLEARRRADWDQAAARGSADKGVAP